MQLALDHKRLDLTFLFCLLVTLTAPSLFPKVHLSFFSPFLAIACYNKTLPSCLWIAFCCGLILDLISSHTRLGIQALNFCFTLIILYPQKRNFFADSLSTLPLMTFFLGMISSMIMAILLYSLEMKNVLSSHWMITEVIVMPAADAVYAFCCFILPALIFGKPRRRGKDYFIS